MCLHEVNALSAARTRPRARILDVGHGQRLLSLACAALGQADITAIDVDPEVMPVAEENLAATACPTGWP
jgi:predicted RNA methylase